MKKMIIAAVAVAIGISAQAATFSWKSTANAMGVDLSAVSGNGTFGVGSQTMKAQGGTTWTVILALYDGSALVGETSVSMKWSTTGSKFNVSGITIDDAAAGKEYSYVLTITGAPGGLTGLTDGSWDYSGASMSTTISGTITTAAMGDTAMSTGVPSSWTVSGATAVPEPATGLLMLVGMAGLALRRRRA